MIRVSTNAVLKNYRYNLQKSTNHLYSAMEGVMTQRQFNSYAANPSAAAQAFQIRRALTRAEGQLQSNSTVTAKFEQAYSALDAAKSAIEKASKREGLTTLNDPQGSARETLGRLLQNDAEALVQTMNSQYAGKFLFAGADGDNVPFTIDDAGDVCFRGIKVNSGSIPKPTLPTPPTEPEWNPVTPGLAKPTDKSKVQDALIAGDIDDDAAKQWNNFFDYKDKFDTDIVQYKQDMVVYEEDQANLEKLKKMAGETTYVDLGLGLKEDANGNLIEASAFNSALSGLSFMGFGADEDGDPKNAIAIIQELGNILSRCDKDTGEWATGEDKAAALRLQGKLDAAMGEVTATWSELSSRSSFLSTNEEQLTSETDTLKAQRDSMEMVDPADAISVMMWAQYAYSSALKIGNSVLSQSLIDYMN